MFVELKLYVAGARCLSQIKNFYYFVRRNIFIVLVHRTFGALNITNNINYFSVYVHYDHYSIANIRSYLTGESAVSAVDNALFLKAILSPGVASYFFSVI